jgi:hypothetical protein
MADLRTFLSKLGSTDRYGHFPSSRHALYLHKGRKLFEYLVDVFDLDNHAWITENHLRISLSPMLVAKLKGN